MKGTHFTIGLIGKISLLAVLPLCNHQIQGADCGMLAHAFILFCSFHYRPLMATHSKIRNIQEDSKLNELK